MTDDIDVKATAMPNGKPLAQCTGAECWAMGTWLTRVGLAVAVRASPADAKVGDILTNTELAQIDDAAAQCAKFMVQG